MQDPIPEKVLGLSLHRLIREDPTVKELIEFDPKTEIFTQMLFSTDVQQLQKEYPDIFKEFDPNYSIFSVNVISSRFLNGQYKKIKLYYNHEFQLLKKITS